MKISPVPSSVVPTIDTSGVPQPSRVDTARLRMKTNANPIPPDFIQQQGGGLPIEPNNIEARGAVADTQPLSPQLALLAKQRRALQVKEREIANREKALSQGSQTPSIDLARLKSDPLSVLLESGVTYDQLTEAILNNQGNSEVNALKAEIQALKQGIDQKFSDQTTQAEQAALNEMKREAEKLVASGDDYEFVRERKGMNHVMDLIKRTYKESGEVLDVSEALQLVEEELFKDAQKLMGLKKVQRAQSPEPQMQTQLRHTGMRTLTNRDTAQPPLSPRARALAAFYGNKQ